MRLHIFIVVIAVTVVGATTSELLKIINQLAEGIQARSLVFYEFPPSSVPPELLRHSPLPFVVLNKDSPVFRWRSTYNRQVLSIILLRPETDEAVWLQLKQTLWGLHQTDVLFVGDNLKRQQLFERCWQNGFYNVLQTDQMGSQLWTFNPFPRIQSANTSLSLYLEQRNRWHDFQGYPIRIAYGNNPPFALVYESRGGQQIRASGLAPLIVKLFTRYYNATLVSQRMPDLYTILDCLAYLRSGKVDMCADIAPWGASETFGITKPQRQRYAYVMVRHDRPIEKSHYFVATFKRQQWLLIALCWGILALTLTTVYWWQTGKWRFGKFCVESLRSLLSVAFNINGIEGHTKSILIVTLIVGGFMLSNYYLAYLSSILTIDIYDRQIDAFPDLLHYNINILANKAGRIAMHYLNVADEVIRQTVEVSKREYDQNRKSLNTNYAYCELLESCLFYMQQQRYLQRPRMKLLREPLYTILGGSPIAKNWPFEDILNKYISRIYEQGFIKRVHDDAVKEAHDVGILQYFVGEERAVKPLNLEYMRVPMLLLIGGYVGGSLVFLMELFLKWRK